MTKMIEIFNSLRENIGVVENIILAGAYVNFLQIDENKLYNCKTNELIGTIKENGEIIIEEEQTNKFKLIKNGGIVNKYTGMVVGYIESDKIKNITNKLEKTTEDENQALLTYLLEINYKETNQVSNTSETESESSFIIIAILAALSFITIFAIYKMIPIILNLFIRYRFFLEILAIVGVAVILFANEIQTIKNK